MSSLSEGTKNIGENSSSDFCKNVLFKDLVVFHVVFIFLCYLSELIEAGVFFFYMNEELKNSLNPSFG